MPAPERPPPAQVPTRPNHLRIRVQRSSAGNQGPCTTASVQSTVGATKPQALDTHGRQVDRHIGHQAANDDKAVPAADPTARLRMTKPACTRAGSCEEGVTPRRVRSGCEFRPDSTTRPDTTTVTPTTLRSVRRSPRKTAGHQGTHHAHRREREYGGMGCRGPPQARNISSPEQRTCQECDRQPGAPAREQGHARRATRPAPAPAA